MIASSLVAGVTDFDPFVRGSLKPFVKTLVFAAVVALDALEGIGTILRVANIFAGTARREPLE
jgi:hypothetical protein